MTEFETLKAQKDELTIQQALREMDARDREYDWTCKMLEQTREEVKRLTAEKETCMETISANLVERTQMWKEREQVKEERDNWLRIAGENGKFYMDALKELEAKDKVLEWYRDESAEESRYFHFGQVKSEIGERARAILSQYAEEEKK